MASSRRIDKMPRSKPRLCLIQLYPLSSPTYQSKPCRRRPCVALHGKTPRHHRRACLYTLYPNPPQYCLLLDHINQTSHLANGVRIKITKKPHLGAHNDPGLSLCQDTVLRDVSGSRRSFRSLGRACHFTPFKRFQVIIFIFCTTSPLPCPYCTLPIHEHEHSISYWSEKGIGVAANSARALDMLNLKLHSSRLGSGQRSYI
ncbi:hypothetical protein F4808DRAFT_90416 [Astrocystis sublimbata]|nr:hypothetical protein F4808DRAFT_90416 [Astrocystis sublimbata]